MITPENLSIRRATADDVDAIARIWHAGWIDGHMGHVPEALVRHRGPDQFVSRARQRVEESWVAEVSGGVVGFIVIVEDELEQIYVSRQGRGTGVAGALVRTAEAEIARAGYRKAWLAVATGNARARAFYERSGWRDAGEISYLAETAEGPLPVPCRRYEREVTAAG